LPGVIAVFAPGDLGEVAPIPMTIAQRPALEACFQPPMPRDRVRYVGEPLAVVVATDRYVAEDALELIHAELEALPVVADARRGLAPEAPILHEALGTNLADRIVMSRGDVERALREAPRRVRGAFAVSAAEVPMEAGSPRPSPAPASSLWK
jgi:carbon-monoxide dehydrogenase large subunit